TRRSSPPKGRTPGWGRVQSSLRGASCVVHEGRCPGARRSRALASKRGSRHASEDLVIAFVARLVSNFMRLVTAPLWYLGQAASRPRARWVHVRLRPRLVEIERSVPFFVNWIPALS